MITRFLDSKFSVATSQLFLHTLLKREGEIKKKKKNNSEEMAVVIFSDCFYLSLNIFPKTIDINFMEA